MKLTTLIKTLLLFLVSHATYSQCEIEYRHRLRDLYAERESIRLIKNLHKSKVSQIHDSQVDLLESYQRIRRSLIKQVNGNQFILEDPMLRTIREYTSKVVMDNSLSFNPKGLVISKDATVNAGSYGLGLIFINLGLLAKIQTMDELLFIICHEIAHYELLHYENSFLNLEFKKVTNRPQYEFNKILNGKGTVESVKKIQEWAYESAGFSRELEVEADSLAFSLYNQSFGKPE